MTKVKNISQNLLSKLKKDNTSNLSTLLEVETVNQFGNELSQKSYYSTYKTLFYVCVGLGFTAQIASIASSYKYVASILLGNIENLVLVGAVAIGILVIIELLKRELLQTVLTSAFAVANRKVLLIPLLLVLIISAVSMYFSIIGGGLLGINTNKVIATNQNEFAKVDSTNNLYDSQILAIRNEIKDVANRNTYKGKTYLGKTDKQIVATKEQQINDLLTAKTKDIALAKEIALKKENEVIANNETNRIAYEYFFCVFELLFFACLVFQFHYKRTCFLENELQAELEGTATNPVTTVANALSNMHQFPPENKATVETLQQTNNELLPNDKPQRIGFTFKNLDKKVVPSVKPCVDGAVVPNEKSKNVENIDTLQESKELPNPPTHDVDTANVVTHDVDTANVVTHDLGEGNKLCLHCGKVYTYKIHNQKFCSTLCRETAWELKTGQKIKKGKKSNKPTNKLF